MKRISIKGKENISATDLLNIQKLVYLLHDWHYDQFHGELITTKSPLPAKLLDTIKTTLPKFDSHEELCRKIYGDTGAASRASFNQLTVHTFRLSEFLAVNHPSYLIHNIQKIQALISEVKFEEANFVAQVLLSLSQKIEDFSTQILVLKFLTQQEHLFKHMLKAEHYHTLLVKAIEDEKLINDIYYMQRKEFNMALMSRKKNEEEIIAGLEFLRSLSSHSSTSISLFSKYVIIYITYYFRHDINLKANLVELIRDFEKEMNNNGYIVFPYLHDIKSSLYLIKINLPEFQISSKIGQNEIARLGKHVTMVKYWKTYLNIPELYALFLRAYTYLNQYCNLLHHKDYHTLISPKVVADIKEIISELDTLYSKHGATESYNNDMMILRELKGGLTLTLGGDNILKGLEVIEMNITHYQQIKKSRGGNSYALLMLGHFGRGDYKKCVSTYTRYLKVAKNKDIHEGNDLYLQIYYYISRWILDHRAEHIVKIRAAYQRTSEKEHFKSARSLAEDLIKYFKLPIDIVTL